MAHVMKFAKAAAGHMCLHFSRQADNISNKNIDKEKTHLNYNLAASQSLPQMEFIRKRCSEVRCQNRKDVNVLVSWVVTAPKDLPEDKQRDFFSSCYGFLSQRYGAENVVSAYVHLDEVSPHMHFAFVPVAVDHKRGGFKVSAKEVVNRQDLQTFHSDLSKYVAEELGMSVSILNEATREGNRSIEELKRKSAAERLKRAKEMAADIEKKAKEQAKIIEGQYQAKRTYVAKIEASVAHSDELPEGASMKKSFLGLGKMKISMPLDVWKKFRLSADEKVALEQSREQFENDVEVFRKTTSAQNIDALHKKISAQAKEIEKLSGENYEVATEVETLRRENNSYQRALEQQETRFERFLTRATIEMSPAARERIFQNFAEEKEVERQRIKFDQYRYIADEHGIER